MRRRGDYQGRLFFSIDVGWRIRGTPAAETAGDSELDAALFAEHHRKFGIAGTYGEKSGASQRSTSVPCNR